MDFDDKHIQPVSIDLIEDMINQIKTGDFKGCCDGCPATQHTAYGMQIADYGCLPTYVDMLKWYQDTGKVWACHERPTQPCAGFIKMAKEEANITVKVTNGLITEQDTLEDIYNGKIGIKTCNGTT